MAENKTTKIPSEFHAASHSRTECLALHSPRPHLVPDIARPDHCANRDTADVREVSNLFPSLIYFPPAYHSGMTTMHNLITRDI